MRKRLRAAALFCLLVIGAGCHGSLSPASVTTLAPEYSSSTVMKEQNYQAVTQAIAQRQEIGSYLKQQPLLARKTFGGKTLLFDAAFFGNKDAAKALIDNGADVNFSTGLGMTPLDSAISSNSSDVITLLTARGARRGVRR